MSLRAPLLIVLVVSTLAGCTDLTPIQSDIKDLRSQVEPIVRRAGIHEGYVG